MSAIFSRERCPAIPLGADADFTLEAAVTSAQTAHAELGQALGCFSRENVRGGVILLESAYKSIDQSVRVLRILQRGNE